MNEKKAIELYTELVVGFNNYMNMIGTYFEAENYIRQADWVQLADYAAKYEVYISDDTTLDDVREAVLSAMKCQILNSTLQIKKHFTFKD